MQKSKQTSVYSLMNIHKVNTPMYQSETKKRTLKELQKHSVLCAHLQSWGTPKIIH